MIPTVRKPDPATEFDTPEQCRILESWGDPSDPGVSIARATVAPGVATQLHSLTGVDERYIILNGTGMATIGNLAPTTVVTGDIVVIPRETPQKIENVGVDDLVFYCICTPRFSATCYVAIE
jgi:mannose-6-phosphate isomerase-like protein (cupin superfamily)